MRGFIPPLPPTSWRGAYKHRYFTFTFTFTFTDLTHNTYEPGQLSWYSDQTTSWTVGATGVRFPEERRNFSLRHRDQTGSGVHPASYPIRTDTRGLLPRGKTVGA
jgi:hypothetical protein